MSCRSLFMSRDADPDFGVLYICHLVHLPEHWTIAMAIVLFGGGDGRGELHAAAGQERVNRPQAGDLH